MANCSSINLLKFIWEYIFAESQWWGKINYVLNRGSSAGVTPSTKIHEEKSRDVEWTPWACSIRGHVASPFPVLPQRIHIIYRRRRSRYTAVAIATGESAVIRGAATQISIMSTVTCIAPVNIAVIKYCTCSSLVISRTTRALIIPQQSFFLWETPLSCPFVIYFTRYLNSEILFSYRCMYVWVCVCECVCALTNINKNETLLLIKNN